MDLTEPASIVMSRGTAAVLRVLSGADESFTVRQIARLGDLSPAGAAHIVNRLEEHGLVTVDEHGRSYLCRLNQDHLAAPALIELVRMRARLIELLGRVIGDWDVKPASASLFGSAARGDGGTASDLDVLLIRADGIEVDNPDWAEQLSDTANVIWRASGNHVAWLDLSLSDFEIAVESSEPIVEDWLADGIRLSGGDVRDLVRKIA